MYQGKPGILQSGCGVPICSGPDAVPSSTVTVMQGLHLTADLYQCRCPPAWLTDADQLGDWCLQAVQAVGLQPVNQLFHANPASKDSPAGVTATVLLGQSHICLHTWPGQRAVAVDVYVCNRDGDNSAKARGLMFALVNRFQPEWTEQRSLDRGDESV
jgi:S-adenosylmethionine decarboxylase